ncbi:hypothetical protein GE300_16220 [Rhodobacteraceae bacterium 2CG4]|uniref:Ankyrin repeat protein n=1 Tax=Halovulum marinum TaxID=2662447 RepID=A0A6L5Z4V4_9RHOB|nr:hypothetical protein [Halovulum marinum]MSU91135.1 hypothetical protein [Halovulum marinum]
MQAAPGADPRAATRGVGQRTPILHLAFSQYIRMAPDRRADMLAIARLLLDAGADPNDGMPAGPGSAHKRSALDGALGRADNLRWPSRCCGAAPIRTATSRCTTPPNCRTATACGCCSPTAREPRAPTPCRALSSSTTSRR